MVVNVKEKTMTNKKIWLGMLVMVLAFGMTVLGCEEEPEEYDYGRIELNNYYPIVGETITATFKPDNNPAGTLKWQWFRGNTPIGSDRATYTVVSADVGQTITVKVSNNGKNCANDASTRGVLNTPATATVSISMVAYRIGSSYDVEVTLTLSDGRWNPSINVYNIFDSLVTLSGTPDLGEWSLSGGAFGSSFNVRYTTASSSVPSINLTATIDSTKVAGIRSSTNVYSSLTAGTPSSVAVSQWTMR